MALLERIFVEGPWIKYCHFCPRKEQKEGVSWWYYEYENMERLGGLFAWSSIAIAKNGIGYRKWCDVIVRIGAGIRQD